MAGQASVFVDHLTAAIRAGAHDSLILFDRDLGIITDYPADGIRTGQDLVTITPSRRRTADPGNLLQNRSQADSGPQGQRDQPSGGLDLRRGTPSGLAHLGKA